MRVKKSISEVVFSLLAFSREWKFVAVIRVSYPRYKSSLQFLNVFVFIHRKTLSIAEVYIGYNLNAQTHTINSPAWSGLSQSYAF